MSRHQNQRNDHANLFNLHYYMSLSRTSHAIFTLIVVRLIVLFILTQFLRSMFDEHKYERLMFDNFALNFKITYEALKDAYIFL